MDKINFSLVFATRQRVSLLNGLFQSLSDNTCQKEKVEIIPVYDEDDYETDNTIPEFLTKFNDLNIKFIKRTRSIYLNEDYINYAARQSSGDFVHVINDDVEYLTKCWDEIGIASLREYLINKPDGIVYGFIDDSMNHVRNGQKLQYTGFPIISREAIDCIGYAMGPAFPSWGADIHLYRIYNSIGRVLDLTQIKLLHISHHCGLRVQDETSKHVSRISGGPNCTNVSIDAEVDAMKEAMGITDISKVTNANLIYQKRLESLRKINSKNR